MTRQTDRWSHLAAAGCTLLLCGSARAESSADAESGPRDVASSTSWRPKPRLDVGLDVGLVRRPAAGEDASYATAMSGGGHVRVNLASWLGLRILVQTMSHAVTLRDGALNVPGAHIDQPDLETLSMQAWLEPSWSPVRHVRLWAGPWIGWGRITAPEPRIEGELSVRSAERYGVILEGGVGFGTTYEIVPRWVTLNTALGAGLMINQTGSMFQEVQGFDEEGHRLFIGKLPDFSGCFQASAGLGVLL